MALAEALEPTSERRAGAAAAGWRLSAITPSSRYYWLRLLLENPAVVLSLLLSAGDADRWHPGAGRSRPYDPNFVNPADRLDRPSSDLLVRHRRPWPRCLQPRRLRRADFAAGRDHGDDRGDGRWARSSGWPPGTTGGSTPSLMRVMDGLEAFPSILLAIAIMATLGAATRERDHRAVGGLSRRTSPGWCASTTLMNREQTYVESARAIGMRDCPDHVALHLPELAVAADRAGARSSSPSGSWPRRRSRSSAPGCRPIPQPGAAWSAAASPGCSRRGGSRSFPGRSSSPRCWR